MSAKKTPLQTVKEQGGKEKLVDKIVGLIESGGEEADELKKRLLAASNSKLLRLAQIGETLKQKYGGSRDKLAAEVASALGRAKDNDYVKRLGEYSPGRLLDLAQSLARRAGAAAGAAATATRAVAAKQVEAAKEAAKKAAKAAKAARTPAAKGARAPKTK
jgi:hypothetical protein